MSNFYTDGIRPASRFRSVNHVTDAPLLEPKTRAAVAAIIADAVAEGGADVVRDVPKSGTAGEAVRRRNDETEERRRASLRAGLRHRPQRQWQAVVEWRLQHHRPAGEKARARLGRRLEDFP